MGGMGGMGAGHGMRFAGMDAHSMMFAGMDEGDEWEDEPAPHAEKSCERSRQQACAVLLRAHQPPRCRLTLHSQYTRGTDV